MRLKTTYMGLELKNPLVPSASPMSREVDTVFPRIRKHKEEPACV